MATYHLSIITATGKVFDGDVESTVLSGVDGEFGVLAGHTPLISALKEGILKVTADGSEKYYITGEGYVDVSKTGVSVLVGEAKAVKDMEAAKKLLKSDDPWASEPVKN